MTSTPLPPPPTLKTGSVGQNFTFSGHGQVTYQIKENHEYRNMVAIILPADTPDPGYGVRRESRMQQHGSKYFARRQPDPGVSRSKFIFFEYGPVAYQIEENHEYSNIIANILHADSLDPGDGVNRSKFNFFRSWSCCILI